MDPNNPSGRLDLRVAARIAVAAFGVRADHETLAMETRNLSAGGALCASPTALPPGRTVTLRLDLPDETGTVHPVVTQAIVLRADGSGPFALAFLFVNVPGRVREILQRFVARRLDPSAGR